VRFGWPISGWLPRFVLWWCYPGTIPTRRGRWLSYVPLTTQSRGSRYEVALPNLRFLDRDSVANVQGIGSMPVVRLERRLGRLPEGALAEIRKAILFSLDMDGGA